MQDRPRAGSTVMMEKESRMHKEEQSFNLRFSLEAKFPDEYDGEDEWIRFDEGSPRITAAFHKFNQPKSTLRSLGARIIKFPTRSK